MTEVNTKTTGSVVQIIGAVVDCVFLANQVPKVYHALEVEYTNVANQAAKLVLEVQQQLGDGVVRCIACRTVSDSISFYKKNHPPGRRVECGKMCSMEDCCHVTH